MLCSGLFVLLSQNYFDVGGVRMKDNILLPESSRIANLGIMRMIGLTKSMKNDHGRHSEDCTRKEKKVKASPQKQS